MIRIRHNASLSDPYHFDTDPDPGSKKFVTDTDRDHGELFIRIQIRMQENHTDPDQAKKD